MGWVIDQLVLSHKLHKILESEMVIDHFIPRTKHQKNNLPNVIFFFLLGLDASYG
jgi:5-methylcytosine-specific restriction endonuclease McrA